MTQSQRAFTLGEIAELTGGTLQGDPAQRVTGLAALSNAGPEDLTWAGSEKFLKQLADTKAAAAIVAEGMECDALPTIACRNVEHAMGAMLRAFELPTPHPRAGVHPSAIVAETATLGEGVAVGPHVIVEDGATIGRNTVLHGGVHIGAEVSVGEDCLFWDHVVVRERCTIGSRVIVHPSAVIGAEGFGYYQDAGKHVRYPHVGSVRIGDDVEIGAGSCIDRAKVGETVVGPGVKIDNLVQVAHNVQVGANSLLCAQVGVAGSAKVNEYVVVGGQAGIRDNIELGAGSMIAACSCVPHDVPPGSRVSGVPAVEAQRFFRELAARRKLPDLLERIRELTKRIERLEAATDDRPGG